MASAAAPAFLCIEFISLAQHRHPLAYLLNVLWHQSQNAVLFAWSFASRPGCVEACG